MYPRKCPFCQSEKFAIVQPTKGKWFYLHEAGTTSEGYLAVYKEMGMPVDLYKCGDCGFFSLRNDENFNRS